MSQQMIAKQLPHNVESASCSPRPIVPCVLLFLTRCAVAAIEKLPSLLSCVTAMKMRSLNDVTIRFVEMPCTVDNAEMRSHNETHVREEGQKRDSS